MESPPGSKRFYSKTIAFTSLMIAAGAIIFFVSHLQGKKAAFTGQEKSIAVFPFINTDSSKVYDYLSDGITSEIAQQLSVLSDLRVVPTNQVRAIKNAELTDIQIANKLHAASILKGKIRKNGDAIDIHVDLIDAGSGNIIWSKAFNGNMRELFSFQNELARVITEELNTEITKEEKSKLESRPTQSLEAYDQYLKGIYFWNKRDAVSLKKAIELFNRAIQLDSNYARAWSGLADCYSALGYGSHDAPSFDFLKAETAARKALSLDSSLAEPHTSLGYIDFYYYWNWEKAEKEFLTAIRLNPNYPLAHDAYVYFLTARERFAEAAVEMEKAAALDPASAFIQTDRGFALYYAGHYDRAISSLKEVLIRYPSFPLAWLWLGRAYQEKKMYPESLHAYEMAMNKDSVWPVALAASGFVMGSIGEIKETEKKYNLMIELTKHRYVTPYALALMWAGMKNKDKTMEWLNQGYTERTNWMVWLKLDPRWLSIKNDPSYLLLVQKMGLNTAGLPVKMD